MKTTYMIHSPSSNVDMALLPADASKSAPPCWTSAEARAIRAVDSVPTPMINHMYHQ